MQRKNILDFVVFFVFFYFFNSPSSSKKKSSRLQTCGCVPSSEPTACCTNCAVETGCHFNTIYWKKCQHHAGPLTAHGGLHSATCAVVPPVYVGHVLHHDPPQVLVEVRQAGESPLQHLCVLRVQQGGDQQEEVGKVRVKVRLQVSGQLHHQAGKVNKNKQK